MALRVFACARGHTRGFHAVCAEKGMGGAGRARRGVYEGVVRVYFGARRLEDQTRHPAKRGFQERSPARWVGAGTHQFVRVDKGE